MKGAAASRGQLLLIELVDLAPLLQQTTIFAHVLRGHFGQEVLRDHRLQGL